LPAKLALGGWRDAPGGVKKDNPAVGGV